MRKEITLKQADTLSQKYHIDHTVVPFDQWVFGLNIELEHGSRNPLTNITNDDLDMTAKITLAHLMEFPNYYEKLEKMEQELEEQWKGYSSPPSPLKNSHK